MSWQFLIAISILLFSVESLLSRVIMKRENSDPYAQNIMFAGTVGLFSLAILIFQGGPKSVLTVGLLPYFVAVAILCAFGGTFMFAAYKRIQASELTILMTSSKFWSITGAVVILGEILTPNKLIGAAAIILGVLVTEWKKEKFVFNLGATFALLSAFCYAVAEIVGFYLLRSFDTPTYMVYVCALIVIFMVVIHPKSLRHLSFYLIPQNLQSILAISFLDTVANFAVKIAYQLGRNALQIDPLASLQTIVTVFLAYLFLRERECLGQKLLGASLAFAGALILL